MTALLTVPWPGWTVLACREKRRVGGWGDKGEGRRVKGGFSALQFLFKVLCSAVKAMVSGYITI